jgi:hypothetical protein
MGLRPTRARENLRRRPRASGGPGKVDSRFRGNDLHGLTFRRARENLRRRPRASGGPGKVDSRFRGNDLHGLTFRRAADLENQVRAAPDLPFEI